MGRYIILSLLFLIPALGVAQEHDEEHEEHHEHVHHHQLGIVIGHAHLSQGIVNEGKKWRVLPSWALFYNYKFNEKWGIGIHVDWIVEDFEVERHLSSGNSEEVILREKPIAPAIMGLFKPTRHSTFMLGVGAEYASGETFALTRVGYEWSTLINNKWELVIPVSYDFRWDAYDIWNIGMGVSRVF
jgi:hypothetical protein